MTQVEALAKYAARASFSDLSAESRRQLPIHILDSLACCIAAIGAGPVEACRQQVAEFGSPGQCALIGGEKANPIYAAFWHTALVRYVDFMDNFLAPTETCHTADNFGVALTIADYVGGTGHDLMLGVALGYTVQSRLVDHADFMTRGFDHTSQLAFSLNAAAGRLLDLSEQQIAHAIAMAAVSDASFAVVRAKPLSQWKGLASAQSALGAMNTLFLARRGVQGPLRVIEGPNGIDNLLHMRVRIDWEKEGYEGVLESTIKKYNAMIHTQSAVHCMVELARRNKLDPAKVISIETEVFQLAYDFAGGGLYGVDKAIQTKEQADHSLPYLLAVALLDGDVMPAQFKPERIIQAEVEQRRRSLQDQLDRAGLTMKAYLDASNTTQAKIDANKAGIRKAFSHFIQFGDGKHDAIMPDNADWLAKLNYIDFLRDVGRHFSVNRMLAMDSVKLRLTREQELSFLEFNYMCLQAYDFTELNKRYGVTLQMGGSDQWGNIVTGVDLGRRMGLEPLYA